MNNNKTNFILGAVLIAVGAVLTLHRFTDYRVWWLFNYFWPVFWVVVGTLILIKNKTSKVGIIILAIGMISFVSETIDFSIWKLWPVGLIALGLYVIVKSPSNGAGNISEETDKVDKSVIFWGLEKKITSKNFKGGQVSAVFGGIELDLSEVELADRKATLDINAIFGGVEVRVPKDVQVVDKGSAIAGGYEIKTKAPDNENAPRLIITGSAVFGGIEIKN